MLKSWQELPEYMKNEAVKPYYDRISKKKLSLYFKRMFDVVVASIMLVLFIPIFAVISVLIKLDSRGPVFFKQERVTQYGKRFYIYKFRTMVNNAESLGTQVTVENDSRITRVGNAIRKYRIDEFPQLINVIKGEMSFVGTRPEVPKYVEHYTDEMYATLLLPAGITSMASIKYKDEDTILNSTEDADSAYENKVLPEKMKYNLQSLYKFSIIQEFLTMIKTVIAVV